MKPVSVRETLNELDALLERQYEPPILVEYGDVAEVALGDMGTVKDYGAGLFC